MQKTIPAHLASTYQLIQCAFPHGIDNQMYFPLLRILYEHMSDRNLAQVISEYSGKDYYGVLNDIYGVGELGTVLPEGIDSVKQKLMNCNYYENWLAGE
jgi:hypothetical protein